MLSPDRGRLVFSTPDGQAIAPDVIVVRPIREWRQSWTDWAHDAGQIVIADLDDDVWAHEDWTPDSRPDDDNYEEWCFGVDAFLVSTPRIAWRVRERGYAGSIYVAPNCYDPWGMQGRPEPLAETRRIGTRLWLSGRMSADLALYDELILPQLADLDLAFVHIGAEPGQRFTDRGWPQDRLVEQPAVPLPLMGRALSEMSVGCVVMGDHEFNRAKTETIGVEMGGAGLPLLAATDHRLYIQCPGRVEPTVAAVRKRLVSLMDPVLWRRESERAVIWARAVAERGERRHMEMLHTAVSRLYSRRDRPLSRQ